MLLTFAVAVRRGLHRIVDIAWGVGFTAVAAVTLGASAGEGDVVRRLLVTSLTAVWGLRLAVHIARRGRGHGEDPRYEAMLAKAPGSRNLYALRMVYLLQGALVWLVSLPVQAAAYVPGPALAPRLGRCRAVGARPRLRGGRGRPAGPVQGRPRAPGTDHGPRAVGVDPAPQLLR